MPADLQQLSPEAAAARSRRSVMLALAHVGLVALILGAFIVAQIQRGG